MSWRSIYLICQMRVWERLSISRHTLLSAAPAAAPPPRSPSEGPAVESVRLAFFEDGSVDLEQSIQVLTSVLLYLPSGDVERLFPGTKRVGLAQAIL